MLAGLWLSKGIKAIRGVMVAGSTALLVLSVVLTGMYLSERSGGNTAEMLFRADAVWYAPLHIAYSVGVDGISVAMLLLSAVIVFTGTFASWQMKVQTKEYFLWFTLLSMGVFGFFICIDLFTMFMFYEIALIPMYLLIGVWGSGRKEYSAMKLTLMLMGGSAFLLIGIFAASRMAGTSMAVLRSLWKPCIALLVSSTLIALVGGYLTHVFSGVPVANALIAFAPGGLEAMVALGLALGLDPLYVTSHHVARFVLLSLSVPLLARRL